MWTYILERKDKNGSVERIELYSNFGRWKCVNGWKCINKFWT